MKVVPCHLLIKGVFWSTLKSSFKRFQVFFWRRFTRTWYTVVYIQSLIEEIPPPPQPGNISIKHIMIPLTLIRNFLVIRHLLRRQLLRWWYLRQQRVRVRVMIGFLVRGRVRIKIRIRDRVRIGVTFNVSIKLSPEQLSPEQMPYIQFFNRCDRPCDNSPSLHRAVRRSIAGIDTTSPRYSQEHQRPSPPELSRWGRRSPPLQWNQRLASWY